MSFFMTTSWLKSLNFIFTPTALTHFYLVFLLTQSFIFCSFERNKPKYKPYEQDTATVHLCVIYMLRWTPSGLYLPYLYQNKFWSYMSEVPHHNNVIFLAKITSECWKMIFSPTDMQVALTIKFLWGLFLSILIHVNLLFYRYGKFKTVFSTPFLCMLLSSWWAKVCEDKVLELMEPDLLTQLVTFHHPQRYFTILQISGNGEGIET